jgi:hypothetical protein
MTPGERIGSLTGYGMNVIRQRLFTIDDKVQILMRGKRKKRGVDHQEWFLTLLKEPGWGKSSSGSGIGQKK